MEIDIPQDVAEQLEQIAQKEGRSVGDVLKRLLSRYVPDAPSGSLTEMARNALEAGIASPHPVDTSARSREILARDRC